MNSVPFVVGGLLCAVFAMRAARLLHAALWLAGVSVSIALMLYQLGAWQVAIIELSVGAGLVTVLFVFAIAVIGDEPAPTRSLIPKPLAALISAAALLLLILFLLPVEPQQTASTEPAFAVVFWENRSLDALLQVMLIFAGVLGVMGLLDDPKSAAVSVPESQPESEKERI